MKQFAELKQVSQLPGLCKGNRPATAVRHLAAIHLPASCMLRRTPTTLFTLTLPPSAITYVIICDAKSNCASLKF
jgi:hypothetical protein